MEKLKAKQIFNKVKKYNEMASYFYQGQDKLSITFSGEWGLETEFNSYKEFAKFIRDMYVDKVVDDLLEGEWKHDGEYFTLESTYDGETDQYELYVHEIN